MAARGGVEPTTFRTEGTVNLHLTNQVALTNAIIFVGRTGRLSRQTLARFTQRNGIQVNRPNDLTVQTRLSGYRLCYMAKP